MYLNTGTMQNMTTKSGWIISFFIRHRIAVLIVTFLITIFFGYFLTKIKMNNDPTKSIPADMPELVAYNKLQKVFNSPRTILVIARFDSTLSLREKLNKLNSWAEQFRGLDGVLSAVHLGSVQVPMSGGFFGLSADYIVSQKQELTDNELRTRIRENPEFTSAFISNNESVLGMMLEIDDSKNQVQIVSHVVKLQKQLNREGPAEILITGATLYAYYIDNAMRHDFAILLPICLVVVFILLIAAFHRLSYVLASLAVIAIAIIWTFGVMGIVGYEFSVVTAIIPVILFPIGVASAIHIFKTYARRRIGYTGNNLSLIQETFQELFNPIVLSSITTFAGFFSFAFSRMIWTQGFGIFTSIGVVFALLLSLILLPIVLSWEKPQKVTGSDSQTQHEKSHLWGFYKRFITSQIQWILLAVIVITIGIIGFLKVRVEGNPIAMFPPNSDIRRSDDIIAENLGGTRFMWILLEHKKAKIETIEQWKEIEQITDYAKGLDIVGGTTSLLPLIHKVSRIMNNEDISKPALSMILGTTSLMGKRFDKYVSAWITEDRQKVKIALICKNAIGGTKFIDLSTELQTYITHNYPDWNALVIGPPVLNDAMTNLLVTTQNSSLIIAFVSVFLILCLIFRSIKVGFIAIVPIVFSTLFVYALMGFFGVAINTVTVIIVNTCIGIGIDYSIHFTAGYTYLRSQHQDRLNTILHTARIKGSVILFNTFIVGIGFLVLAFSSFPPIRHFGIFVFVSMMASALFALAFLPVLFRLFGANEQQK
jgi:predicted RND superfamily exporter protein